jgi:hypothetical protein
MTAVVRAALPLVAAGSVLVACGAGPSSLGAQVQRWADAAGFAGTLRQLRVDLRRVATVSAEGAGERRTVCDVLVTDALSDNEQLPTPDRTLTALLARAYGSAASSGRSCFSGASLDQAQAAARTATDELVQAEARYDALTSTLGATP